jgi:hypothetical protein
VSIVKFAGVIIVAVNTTKLLKFLLQSIFVEIYLAPSNEVVLGYV